MIQNYPKVSFPGKHSGTAIPVALVYANAAAVALSNLGFQFVYSWFESHPLFSPERFFVVPGGASTSAGASSVQPENGNIGLSRFPIIVFSIPFENDYLRAVSALALSGIPCFSADRGARDPVVICGGVSPSVNPEPLALFFDAIFIGEIPEANDEPGFLDVLARICTEKNVRRSWDRSRLAELRGVPGVYLPEAYHFHFREQGPITKVEAAPFHPFPVKAVKRISQSGTVPTALVDHPAAVFDATLLMEINRGCGRACRFCASGWIHRPVRHRSFELFRNHICREDIEGRTVGLIGSDLAGHPELMEILSYIVSHGGKFSLSSIRPEGLTHELIRILRATGQKTVTLAPETASPRMKKIIGKSIPDELFFEKITLLVSNGIPNIRLYFMVGLPSETDDDVLALVDFVLKAREVFVDASRPLKRIGTIGVQLNPFVPKPWTPFQCVGMQSPKVLAKKLNVVRRELDNTPNVRVRAESVREAVMQGLLSRADRRIARPMYDAVVRPMSLSRLLKSVGWHLDFFLYRERDWDELFPWDVVEHGVDKTVLRRVFENALPSETGVSGG